MSFMEQPQPDACRALMPTPENPPPGPPSRPIVCYMPKGHDETDGHAETRRPGPLARRWHGDARPQVTAVDRPDNGQDEGDATEFAWLPSEPEPREPGALLRLALGAGEQRRERVADEHGKHSFHWMQQHPGWLARCDCWGWEEPLRDEEHAPAIHRRWRLHVADELLALLGGPQPDGEDRQHRMDADCWCQPVQADNGAWDHR